MTPSTRDRPAKEPLSVEAVVKAGLKVLRTEGLDAVSMRRVAAELDTGPASLYVYVKNRQDLLNQMFDAVAGEVDLSEPPDPKRWREQLEHLLTEIRNAMDRYPGIARVPLANIPTGPNAMRSADQVLGLLRAGGVHESSAAWFVDVVFLFVNAASFETSIYVAEQADAEAHHEEVHEMFGQLDPAQYPNMTALMPMLASGDGDQRFAFGIRLMINGLLNTEPPDATDTGGA
jgi:AcrR family transcriptional regulator